MRSTEPANIAVPRRTAALRRFGLVVGGALAILGGLMLWRERAVGPYVLGLAAILISLAGLAPRTLSAPEKAWMMLARALGVVSTFVLLTLAWLVILTPLGLLRRLLRKDTLLRRRPRGRETYWMEAETASRFDRPF